jgi:protein O-mannosyl-transferase
VFSQTSEARDAREFPQKHADWLRSRWFFIALIVVATVAAYSNSLQNPFIFDDISDIVGNRSIRQLWPLHKVFFVRPATETALHSRPVVVFTLAINYAMGGLDTLPYHVTNLAIHVLAALALFGIVHRTLALPGIPDRLGRKRMPLALAVALLWALHPLQTQAVTYVIQRYESLMGLFYLATLYCLIRAGTSQHRRVWATACVAAAALAMGSKEVAVSAPIILLLYDRAFLAGSVPEAWAQRRGIYVGLIGIWLGFATLQLLTSNRSAWAGFGLSVSWHEYLMSQCGVILHYLRLSLWPQPLVFDYGWQVARSAREILPGAMIVGGLAAMSVYTLVRRPKLGFLGGWFFLILAPTSSILPLADLAFLHRMYLPLAAIVVLAVLGGERAADAMARRGVLGPWGGGAAAIVVLATAAAALAVGTWQRNRDYESGVSLWRDTVAKAPRNPWAHYNLGIEYTLQGKNDEAMAEYRTALEITPGNAMAHNRLGLALETRGQADEAISHFRRALEIRPDYAEAYNNIGIVLANRGEGENAIAHFRKALEILPDYAEAQFNLGVALEAGGKLNSAIPCFQKALQDRPEMVEARYYLGNALMLLGRKDEAIAEYREALDIKPDYAEAHNNLGVALLERGEKAAAIGHFGRALELQPDFVKAQRNLENALATR